METLRESGPIQFSGSANDRDLRELLQAYGHVGCAYLMLLGFCISLVLLVLFVQGGGLAAIAIGVMSLFVVASVVSTIPYRQLVFENANPQWREERCGELREEGVHVDRRDTRAFFRWDWYWSAAMGDDWIAFIPATGPMQPLIINVSMVVNLDDWRRVQQLALAIEQRSHDSGEQQHRRRNSNLMQEKGRQRSVEVPADAIAYHGTLRASDYSRLPNDHRRRERPARSYVVVGALFCGGAFIVAGVSKLLLQQFAFLPAFLVIYVAMAAIGIAVRKRRRGMPSSGAAYFLNAYATESSMVSDFAITTTEVAWSALELVVRTDDFIAFRRSPRNRFILARRDMFEGEQDWKRFNGIVDKNFR
jgi:hypothetical protein